MIRLEKATELLADKQLTLTETAMLSGFQSISSFNRVFREEKEWLQASIVHYYRPWAQVEIDR